MFVKPTRFVNKVFLHCSASDNPLHDNIETIRNWHIERGWSDIGYHFYINKDGKIFRGRSVELVPAAQKGYNKGSIAICCGGEKHFTAIQMNGLKGLCRDINRAYSGKVTFHGHCEVDKNKLCPVYNYMEILGLDSEGKIKAVSQPGNLVP